MIAQGMASRQASEEPPGTPWIATGMEEVEMASATATAQKPLVRIEYCTS
jgi:hypothetical protein